MPHRRPRPSALSLSERVAEGRYLRVHGRMAWYVRAGQMGPDADDFAPASGLLGEGRMQQLRPPRHRSAAAAHPGVRLQVHPRGHADGPGRGADLPDQAGGTGAEVHTDRDGVAVRRVGRGQHAQHRRGAPGRAQRECLFDVADAEPGRAACERCRRGPHQPVPVAVGFDHGHDLGVSNMLGQRGDVRPDRGEIDDRFRMPVHGPQVCQQPQTPQSIPGWTWRSPDPPGR